jgi:prepilin-type N-terminal cleavage/methylation domain-containing protein
VSKQGFTLIEILIVIALIGILLAIATMSFNDYLRKGTIERQTKELYSDLMMTRTIAVTQRSSKRVTVTSSVFTFISSSLGVSTRVLTNPVSALDSSGNAVSNITFDARGTYNIDDPGAYAAICVNQSIGSAQVDGIIIYPTKIQMGKFAGGACNSANITVK